MSLETHIAELERKHHMLEEKIETEARRPGSNDLDIAALKREKLRLKDEIQRLGGMKEAS